MEAAAWWLADHPAWPATTHINHVSVRLFFPAWTASSKRKVMNL